MGKKKDNNLIKVVKNGREEHYFTSRRQAGLYIDRPECSVLWALTHSGEINDGDDFYKLSIVDGSNVMYKYINN